MKDKTTNYDRYLKKELKKDPTLKDDFSRADVAIDIAIQIYSLRKERGLTQRQVAKVAGIKQSNIARLESAHYKGYSLMTLKKIARALKAKVEVLFVPEEKLNTESPSVKMTSFFIYDSVEVQTPISSCMTEVCIVQEDQIGTFEDYYQEEDGEVERGATNTQKVNWAIV